MGRREPAKAKLVQSIGTNPVTDLEKFNLVKFAYGDLVSGSSQFSLQLPLKISLDSKVVKSDSK